MTGDTFAGRMNRRITLEEAVTTPDGSGGFSTAWEEFATVWAEVKPLSPGREALADARLASQQGYRILMRTLTGLNADMRINHGGRYLNIRAIRFPEPDGAVLEILAEEGVGV